MAFLDFFKQSKQLAEPEQRIIIQKTSVGKSGTELYSGIFSEEYLHDLNGTLKATVFDKMRRSDARVKMCLSAVKNPIRSAQWGWQAGGPEEVHTEHADFLHHCFFENMGNTRKKKFKRLLTEYLTCVDFGYVVMEKTHKLSQGHPKYGEYIGLQNLGWRSPKTIEYFHVDKNGELVEIEQHSYGDIEVVAKMPAKFLSIISLDQEGDNYEGISMLRSAYGAWYRKQVYLKLMAIGIEKTAIGTPAVEVPAGKENSDEFTKLEAVLEALTSHQSNYITYPAGFKFEMLNVDFDAQKVKEAIQFENQEMVFAFLANFLELGSSSSSGSYALSNDLSDFFTNGILYIADMICEELNEIGKELIDLNFGPQEFYPQLKYSGITDKIGKEFAEIIKNLTDSGNFTADDNVENEIRKRLGLPPMREEDQRDNQVEEPTEETPVEEQPKEETPEPEETEEVEEAELTDDLIRIQLAESKARKQITNATQLILERSRQHLRKMNEQLAEDVAKNYSKLSDSRKITAINDVSVKGKPAYMREMKALFTDVSFDALKQASKELPKSARKFMDEQDRFIMAEFEELPKRVRDFLLMQSKLIVDTQGADLEKVVFMQFGDSVISTDSTEILKDDLKQAGETYINGASVTAAGGNTASRLINEARTATFFDDDVLEEIESFTFVNPSPVAPICKDLAGRTFRKDDAEARRNFPPLHHNCKSYIVPNLVGGKTNPQIDERGLKTNKKSVF